MEYVFWLSVLAVYYVFHGYGLVLSLLDRLWGNPVAVSASEKMEVPKLSVIVTVHNEVDKIEGRLVNLFDTDYPLGLMQVIVASDGSTDGTDNKIIELTERFPLQLFQSGGRFGKTATQNSAIALAEGDVVVFSDVDTRFNRSTLANIARTFLDPWVGGVTGRVIFVSEMEGVAADQGRYWSYETKLRRLESSLGVLAVGSGQCIAVRRSIFRQMPEFVGEDCILPLDVVSQGLKFIHVDDAQAYDVMETEAERELRTRIRMTLRNWLGTWRYGILLNPLKNPRYAFSLWSHKLLRWLTPFFIMLATCTLIFIPGNWLYLPIKMMAAFFYILGAVGWLGQMNGRRLPVAGGVYSFLLANYGFMLGVVKALMGHRIITYRSGELGKTQ